MKKTLTITLALLAYHLSYSQTEGAAFSETGRGAVTAFATDYQALGINPANLAFGNKFEKKFTFGFGAIGASLYAEGFTKSDLWDGITAVDQNLSITDKFNAASDFQNSVLSFDINANIFGFSLNTAKAGNFAFGINFRGSQYSTFNTEGANQLWTGYADPYFDQWIVARADGSRDTIANQGPNSAQLDDVVQGFSTDPRLGSSLYDGTVVKAISYMEYSVGYGKTFFENDDLSLSGGVGIKYLQGLYLLNVTIEDNEVKQAYTASSPAIDIDYGSSELTNPSFVGSDGDGFVGSGFGFDLGLALELNDKFRVSAAIVDIGSITFDGNVYSSQDTLVYDIESTGIESYNVFNEFDVFAGRDGIFNWTGLEEQKVNLPTQARFGFGYFYNEKFQFGLDLALPLNDEPGNIDRVAFALGADYIPTTAVRISAGIAAGDNYAFRVPLGFTFNIGEGSWELGVATRDLLYFTRDDRPNVSIAMGLLRFRFGEMVSGSQSRMYN